MSCKQTRYFSKTIENVKPTSKNISRQLPTAAVGQTGSYVVMVVGFFSYQWLTCKYNDTVRWGKGWLCYQVLLFPLCKNWIAGESYNKFWHSSFAYSYRNVYGSIAFFGHNSLKSSHIFPQQIIFQAWPIHKFSWKFLMQIFYTPITGIDSLI